MRETRAGSKQEQKMVDLDFKKFIFMKKNSALGFTSGELDAYNIKI